MELFPIIEDELMTQLRLSISRYWQYLTCVVHFVNSYPNWGTRQLPQLAKTTMTDTQTPSKKPHQPDQPGNAIKGKKQYQKPAFRFERVFETQALSCGKIAPAQGTCHGGSGKTS